MPRHIAPGSTSAASAGQTTNFDYTAGETIAGNASSATAIQGFNAITWQTKNRVALNECAVSNTNAWTITTAAATNGNSVTYTANVSDDCLQLTPTFDKIGK